MQQFVDITFDCLPLRSVTRRDIPLDASPKFRERCERILASLDQYGTHNTYYLHTGRCAFHLTNNLEVGLLEFTFEGTVITDETDAHTQSAALVATLARETCDWLTEPVVRWFGETVRQAVTVEFNRFILAGDLEQTKRRIDALRAQSDEQSGFVGMGL